MGRQLASREMHVMLGEPLRDPLYQGSSMFLGYNNGEVISNPDCSCINRLDVHIQLLKEIPKSEAQPMQPKWAALQHTMGVLEGLDKLTPRYKEQFACLAVQKVKHASKCWESGQSFGHHGLAVHIVISRLKCLSHGSKLTKAHSLQHLGIKRLTRASFITIATSAAIPILCLLLM